MKCLVAFYSRGGSTKIVAEELARALSADLEEIRPKASYSGPIGFLRGGKESGMGEKPEILPDSKDVSSYGLVVVASPIWAGTLASPVRSFIDRNKGKLAGKKTALVEVKGGEGVTRAVAEAEAMLGAGLAGSLSIRTKDARGAAMKGTVAGFAKLL